MLYLALNVTVIKSSFQMIYVCHTSMLNSIPEYDTSRYFFSFNYLVSEIDVISSVVILRMS
jgi:hypothetical protein